MKLYNSHTHTKYSHDGKGTVAELCKEALNNKLSGFAVTDHCDCEYFSDASVRKSVSLSFNETAQLKERYSGILTLSCGVEIGEALFAPDFADSIIASHPWDVVLGSVHAVRYPDYEMPFSLIDFSAFTDEMIDRYVTKYFSELLIMSESTDYDILSHLTVVLRYVIYKYNKKIDIKKHYPVIEEILKTVIKRDKTLEVNTSGLCDGYLMPDTEILTMYKNLKGEKISLGSDSHSPEKIASGLYEGRNILLSLGFHKLTYYENRKPVQYSIL